MNASAAQTTDSEYQPIYAANMLANLAAQIVRSDESATGWDQYEGYIDSTNTNRYPDLTRDAYIYILDEIQKKPELSTLFMGLNRLQVPEPGPGWFRSLRSMFIPTHRQQARAQEFQPSAFHYFDPAAHSAIEIESEQDSFDLLLIQQLEDEISELEQDIHSSIRQDLRKQLTFLIMASIRERGENQELLNIRSIRGLYRFLARSQCISTPSLSLSADGEIYARWRESRNRSIGCMFLTGTIVEYGLRNLPKQHGGTTSPAELWSLAVQLGFEDMIRPSAEQQVA